MRRNIWTFIILSILTLIGTQGFAFAHGIVYEEKMVGENTLRVTLKPSDGRDENISITSFVVKKGKNIDVAYEIGKGAENNNYKDLDLRTLLPPVCIKLFNVADYDNPIFSDLKGHYAQEYIHHLHDANIINGRDNEVFAPSDTITRAEFMVLMVKALKLQDEALGSNFHDIESHWARSFILKAIKKGMVSGYEDDTFRPDNPITVGEVSTIIAKSFNFRTGSNGIYSKLKQNKWYSSYVKKMFDSGILNVNDNVYGSFDEESYINRADCSIMVSRAITTY